MKNAKDTKKIDKKAPYNAKSNYGKLFTVWKKAQVMTRSQLISAAKKLGMTASAASATVTVLISPRKDADSCRGADCLGNISARGEYYFADKLNRKKGEDQKFRLRYRKVILAPKTRKVKEELKAVKTKAKAKSTKSATVAKKATKKKTTAKA